MSTPDSQQTDTPGATPLEAAAAPSAAGSVLEPAAVGLVVADRLLLASGLRNVMWLGAMLLIVAGAGFIAFWLDQSRTSYKSETYESSVAYSESVAEEKEAYDIPLDYRLAYQGGTLIETDTNPSNTVMMQTAKILAPHRTHFVAEYYASRWRQEGMKVVIDKSQSPALAVLAVNKNTGESINVAIKPSDLTMGESFVHGGLRRPLSTQEKDWFDYPKDLPMPPEGSELTVRGGGMGPAARGRSYSLVVPMPTGAVLDHYLNRLSDMGWNLKLATAPGGRTGVTSYMCERGADVYMMHVSRMDNRDATRSLVMFMPF